MSKLLKGELVRLTAANGETDAAILARWSRDAEYARLLDTDPAFPRSAQRAKEDIEQWIERERPDGIEFMIRKLDDNQLLGFVGLANIQWTHGDAFVGIAIGEREYWGKGYGTDAMRVMLHYAFTELNLHRVSLEVFEYNTRAQRSYQKAGFVVEGCERQYVQRDGKRYDVVNMGILREEWERMTNDKCQMNK